MLYLVTIFAVLFTVLAWRRPDWAVMLIIVALPSYLIRFNIFGLPSTLLEVMIWLVFLVWLLKNYKLIFENLKFKIKNLKLKNNNRYPFDWEIILLLIVALVAVGISGFSAASLGIWKAYFFEPILFYILVLNIFKGDAGREKILWSLAMSAMAVALLAVYQQITGQLIDNPMWQNEATRRVVSFFGYPNAVGLFLGPLVLFFIGYLVEIFNFQFSIFKKFSIFNFQTVKLFFIILTIVLSVSAIYFAKSKGALIGVAFGLIVFGFLAGGKKIKWGVIILALAAVISVAVCQPCYNYFLDKTIYSKSYQIRQVGWQETWKMLADGRIITGAGLANYQKAVAPYHQEGVFIKDYRDPNWLNKIRTSAGFRQQNWQPLEIYLYPHNIILNFWSELGLAGMLLFLWIIIKYFYMGIFNFQFSIFKQFSMNKFLNIGLVCAMVVVVVHGLVDVPYFKNDLAVTFWLLVAVISMLKLEKANY